MERRFDFPDLFIYLKTNQKGIHLKSFIKIRQKRVYANSMWHFGKGLAYARNHHFHKADQELKKKNDSVTSAQLREHPPAFNPGLSSAGC